MKTSPKPVTLLIVFWDLGLGGVQKKMTDISRFARTSEGKNLRVHLVLRNKPEFRFDTKQTLHAAVMHYRPIFFRDRVHIPFSLFCLWQMFWTRPGTVLTFLDHASFIAIVCTRLLFWRHIRVVVNEDTFTSGHTTSWIKRRLISLLYPMANLVISPTETSRHDLVHVFGIPPSKITVIPNWTLTQKAQRNQKPIYDLVYIGRFAKQKNIPYLLRIVDLIRQTRPRVTLCLVGDGQEKSAIQQTITSLGIDRNVRIKNSSHDVSSYLGQSSIFVLTSWYEGMPVALLEAMAAGTSVVTSDFPGVSEYIIQGKTGFIAKTEKMFVAYILKLLSDRTLRETLRKNAELEIQTMYSYGALKQYIEAVLYTKDWYISRTN